METTTRIAARWMRWASPAHRKNIALMKWLAQATKRLGVAQDTYIVGGAVRNFVIDRPIKDLDIVIDSVAASHDSEWLAKQLQKLMPVATSLVTNQYGVAILTIKGSWVLGEDDLRGEVLEIANARKESYGGAGGKGYKPSEVLPATIEEDVVRREFSFNTLLWRLLDLTEGPEKAEIIDLTGCGLRDLKEGVLQCPRDPDVVFSDDPTRILRAIKFTGKYGFRIPSDLASSIRKNAPMMKRMPWEAIGTLLTDTILQESTAQASLKQMKSLGILDVISEMIESTPAFASYMAGKLRQDRRIPLLLDMLELGVPAKTPLSFLSREDQRTVREITVGISQEHALAYVETLIKPPVDTRRVIEELGLKGPERSVITPTARRVLVDQPDLAWSPKALTDAVIQQIREEAP